MAEKTELKFDSLERQVLIGIVEALLRKYGSDAVDIATQLVQQSERDQSNPPAIECRADKPVHNQGSSKATAVAKFKAEKKEKNKKEFDMTRYRQRHIAIQIQYEGENFYGFTSQTGGCEETVEKHIFEALIKLRLITDKHTCHYSRCGRTDRGVSALGQTIALKVRSSIPMSVEQDSMPKHPSDSVFIKKPKVVKQSKCSGVVRPSKGDSETEIVRDEKDGDVLAGRKRKGNYSETDAGAVQSIEMDTKCEEMEVEEVKEMDFCGMLNRVLPDSIRALGWCEVTPDFSSRFSCAYRKYRYFFVRRDLNINAMSAGADLLVGDHDFRNICKIDIAKVTNFKREVYSANILLFQENAEHPELSVYMLEIRGIAFLWHMVRCIMALLFMIGEGEENPDAVTALLDIENMPAKPHYKMAPELPLVLHECGFDNMKINLQPPVLWTLTGHYEALWEKHTIAASRAKNALESLKSWEVRKSDVDVFVSYLTGKKKSICDRKSGWKGDKSSAVVDKSPRSKTLLLNPGDLGCDSKVDPFDTPTLDMMSSSVISRHAMDSETDIVEGGMEVVKSSDSDPTQVAWRRILDLLSSQHSLSPTDPLLPHVPLIQRHTNDTYMDRRNQLKGNKKERLDRHLHLKETNSETDPDFFSKMRGQGAM